jgi:hypothetical protein
MRKLLPGIVFLLIYGLFFAGLPFDQAEARVNRPKTGATDPVFKKYTQYSVVRERLLQSKWEPVRRNRGADPCQKDDKRCEGRPEMQSCAGTSEANCIFLWKKNGRVREISTIENEPVIAGSKSCPLRIKEKKVQLCPSPDLD